MADYGIQIKNYGGEIQIDGTYKNFALNQEGSTSVSGQTVDVNFTDVSSPPILAIRPNAQLCCVQKFSKSGSNFVDARVFNEYWPANAFTLYWAVFIGGYVATLPTYGLIIRNSSNEIVFSSADKWLKIVGVYSGSEGDSVTVVDADNYFLMYPFSSSLDTGAPTWGYKMLGIQKEDATTVKIDSFIAETGYEIVDQLWFGSCQLIEIEV